MSLSIRAARYGLPLSLAILDLDHFKRYNDSFGHPAGDRLLQDVADILLHETRDSDLVARIGGEEFALLLPQTAGAGARLLAERCLARLRAYEGACRPVTASAGVAALTERMGDGAALVAAADSALYRAKAGGRDQAVTADEREPALAAETAVA